MEESTGETRKIITISKEELAALPMAHYQGDIKLVETPEEARAALEHLSAEPLVGFDTETRPSFKKGQNHKVALLQLYGGNVCYLIRINKTGLLPEIVDFLEDSAINKVGLSIHDDFHNLNKLAQVAPEGFVELQQYVKEYSIADNSLTKICGIVLGERISKGQRLTNWEAEKLTAAQQQYAALDAQACVRLYQALSSGQFIPENSVYYKVIPTEENEQKN